MAVKEFRFGVCVRDMKSRSAFADTAKGFESLGFDALCVPDHLAAVAPFPALTAPHRQAPPCGWVPYVLNAGFCKPARTRGRPGRPDQRRPAGTGAWGRYAREDFEAAELAFPNARSRVDHLEHVITYIWDRVLTLAAREADIVGLSGGAGTGNPTCPDRMCWHFPPS
jgi:hypothetical protein